jgi:hypothetical protein
MLLRVAVVRTDVSEELSASILKVTNVGELGTTLAVTSNRRMLRRKACVGYYLRVTLFQYHLFLSVRRLLVTADIVPSSPILVTLMLKALRSAETSVLTRTTRRNIPEDTVLHSLLRENLKSYMISIIPSM